MQQDQIWEVYQNDPQLQHIGCADGGRNAFIAKQIAPGQHVLNVGVGRGTLEALLKEKGGHVSALDPSATSIERLRERLGLDEQQARVGYSQAMPFEDGSFDVVVMSEVLEHLEQSVLEATLAEVARVLKPAGCFLGTVPADESLENSIIVCPHCGEQFHRWGHEQSFSRERLAELLRTRFMSVTVRRVVLNDPARLNWKGKVSRAIRLALARLDRPGSGQNFYFEATLR
jgi:ubiquinone/menaquinone biosynthesis C-methylase UbiE